MVTKLALDPLRTSPVLRTLVFKPLARVFKGRSFTELERAVQEGRRAKEVAKSLGDVLKQQQQTRREIQALRQAQQAEKVRQHQLQQIYNKQRQRQALAKGLAATLGTIGVGGFAYGTAIPPTPRSSRQTPFIIQ